MKRRSGTLVVLPGWGGSHETWSEFVETYRRIGDIIVIDLPCFGDEACPGTVWGVEDYATFVRSKLRNIRGTIHLLGHSFGGQVAAKVAADGHDMLMTLTLVGAAAIRPKRVVKRSIFALFAKVGGSLLSRPGLSTVAPFFRRMLYRLADSPDYQETAGIKREIYRKVVREDLRSILPRIQMPTLILWGERDTYTPLRQGKQIAKLITGSTLVTFRDGTHGLHHGQMIVPMIEALDTFFREHGSKVV